MSPSQGRLVSDSTWQKNGRPANHSKLETVSIMMMMMMMMIIIIIIIVIVIAIIIIIIIIVMSHES